MTRGLPAPFNRSNCMLRDLTNSSGHVIGNAPLQVYSGPDAYTARVYASEAERLIQQHPSDSAFFLYMAFTVVHDPAEAPADSIAKYDGVISDPKRKTMGGMVWELDSAIGRVRICKFC